MELNKNTTWITYIKGKLYGWKTADFFKHLPKR